MPKTEKREKALKMYVTTKVVFHSGILQEEPPLELSFKRVKRKKKETTGSAATQATSITPLQDCTGMAA